MRVVLIYGYIIWINFLSKVLTVPAKLLNYKKLDAIDPLRGELYSLECICPHCGNKNFFPALPVNDVNAAFGGIKTFRLACYECNQRFDIPEIIPNPTFEDCIEALFKSALESMVIADVSNAKRILEEIIRANHNYSKAYYLLGEIYFINGDISKGINYIAMAIQVDPFRRPLYYKAFGDALKEIGREEDANIFYNQAEIIITADNKSERIIMPP